MINKVQYENFLIEKPNCFVACGIQTTTIARKQLVVKTTCSISILEGT